MSVMPLSSLARTSRAGNADVVSHLGQSLQVTGLVECEGEVHVLGIVRGRINAVRVVVSADGFVEGDIVAREVRVAGRFDGRIFALNVIVDDGAAVTGRIFHNTISVERGARVDGRTPWRPPNYFESLDQLPETMP
ncbi:MAG: polymer-forming cytoskeletal protein [Alphaproteobacteria bacterium]|nr:polymer-forming cytoskeletal protein [Alphaproteobacteria bacterium]